MKRSKCFWTVLAAVLLVAAGYAGNAQAQSVVSSGFNLNARVDAAFNFDCTNHPGPSISLPEGKITLGSVDAELTLSNNYKFTHSDSVAVSADVNLVFPGTSVEIPKQPSRDASYYGSDFTGTGVGGNPWIYVQFYAENGSLLTSKPVLIGRCVQGAANVGLAFLEAVVASEQVDVDSDSCTNNPGPWIYLDLGKLFLAGVKARVTFTNNAKFTHAASGDAFVDFDFIPAGTILISKKGSVQGGVGGNPHIWIIFKADGEYVGTWPGFYLGRCVKL